jgi:hypothetical protein
MPLVHGTIAGYNYYRCGCAECCAANTEYCYWQRQKRLGRRYKDRNGRWVAPAAPPEGPIEHGKFGTYCNWGCGCELCTDAVAEATRRYRRTGSYV